MKTFLFVAALTFIVGYFAMHTGFMVFETAGPSLYVGPLRLSFDFATWFPGRQ